MKKESVKKEKDDVPKEKEDVKKDKGDSSKKLEINRNEQREQKIVKDKVVTKQKSVNDSSCAKLVHKEKNDEKEKPGKEKLEKDKQEKDKCKDTKPSLKHGEKSLPGEI